MNHPISVFIVNDHRLFTEAVVASLRGNHGITTVGWAANTIDALEGTRSLPIDIVLINADMESTDAVELTLGIKRVRPNAKVVVMGLDSGAKSILKFIEAGASGYVIKKASFEDVLQTINSVHSGEPSCSPRILASVFARIAELCRERNRKNADQQSILTPRQTDILQLVAAGLGNKEIAHEFQISLSTVKNHIHNIFEKLQVNHRREAIRRGYETGILKRRSIFRPSNEQDFTPVLDNRKSPALQETGATLIALITLGFESMGSLNSLASLVM